MNTIENVNLAVKYSSKVAERFKMKSLSEGFVNHEYDWEGVKTVNVYSLPTVALTDYGTTGEGHSLMSRYGTPSDLTDTVQTMTLTQDKAFTFTIDKGTKVDSMNVRGAGKALRREIDEVIVPTEDKYVFGKLGAAAAGNSMIGTGSLTKSNAYEKFLAGQAALDNKLVPTGGRVAAVNASTFALLKQDNSFILGSEIGQKMLINGQVGTIDGVKIVKVPDSYLPENCQFIITHPSVTVKADKLKDYKIHDNPVGIDGNVVEGRVYYDAFVLDAKKDGVYAHYTSAPATSA